MVSVSIALGATSPAEAKARLAAQLEVAKAENEGKVVIESAEQYVGQIFDSIPADHETSVTFHLFVQVEHRGALVAAAAV